MRCRALGRLPIPALVVGYGLAIAASGFALLLALTLDPLAETAPFPLFLAAVLASVWIGELGPGLLATGLSAAALDYLFLPPPYHLLRNSPGATVQLFVFVAVAFFAILLHERLRQARRRAEAAGQSRAFLARASARLTASLDYDAIVATLARLALPTLAAGCIIVLLDEERALRHAVVAHVDPAIERALQALVDRALPQLADACAVARVVHTGRAEVLPRLPDVVLTALAPDATRRAERQSCAGGATLVAPLVARERAHGALILPAAGPCGGDNAADLALVEDLAARAALALDNASLHRAAQAAVRQREQFLAIASHELRTPLTTVKGYSQLLARQARQPALDREQVAGLAEQLQRQVARLEALVADLLDASHLQRGHLDLHPEPVDLVALARQVLDRFEYAPERTPRHVLALDAPAPVTGQWDAGRLDQVLTNLIANALKYSPLGGEVRVGVYRRGDWAELTVRDQGIGIPADEQATLFEPFARGQDARQYARGAGLGLYIAAQIVERHGGTVAVHSQPGAGSTFTVRLSLAPPV
jgi:K+-sensing histidine kinase KdpD